MEKQSYLTPSDFCHKHARIKRSGEYYWTKARMKEFAETYCNVPLWDSLKDKIHQKMYDLQYGFSRYDMIGLPIYTYTDTPKCVDLYN